MTGAPVFADPWEFLTAWVLVVADDSGRLRLLQDPDGGATLPVRTDRQRAESEVPDGCRLLQAPVSEVLTDLPAGVSVTVDPGSPAGIHLPADYVEGLRRLLAPIPPGASVEAWGDLPEALRSRLAAAASGLGQEITVWALVVRVQQSPRFGLLVHEVRSEDPSIGQAVNTAIVEALDACGTDDLGVAAVRVAARDQLPPDQVGDIAWDDLPRVGR